MNYQSLILIFFYTLHSLSILAMEMQQKKSSSLLAGTFKSKSEKIFTRENCKDPDSNDKLYLAVYPLAPKNKELYLVDIISERTKCKDCAPFLFEIERAETESVTIGARLNKKMFQANDESEHNADFNGKKFFNMMKFVWVPWEDDVVITDDNKYMWSAEKLGHLTGNTLNISLISCAKLYKLLIPHHVNVYINLQEGNAVVVKNKFSSYLTIEASTLIYNGNRIKQQMPESNINNNLPYEWGKNTDPLISIKTRGTVKIIDQK